VRNSLDLPAVQSRNLDQDNAALGLAWRPSTALETRLLLRETRGRFPTFRVVGTDVLDDPFTQRGAELATRWRPAGDSEFEARVASAGTRYGRGGDRDFDSVSGSLVWGWRATGKLSLNTRLARDKGQDNFPTVVPVAFGPFLFNLPAVQSDLRTTDTPMATILLTGATGYIASHTWLALQARRLRGGRRRRLLATARPRC
jgi:hypothetical protein